MTSLKRSGILGIGAHVPEKVLSNDDLAHMVDTNDEWIVTRTGIRERRILSDGETVASLGAEAGKAAIENAGLKPEDIDLLIVCTYTPDRLCPSAACSVHAKLGLDTAPAFDVNAACTGFMYGLHIADNMVKAGAHRNVLVIGVEGQSRYVDYTDRATCILFGDGAGAVVVGAVEDGDDRGILCNYLATDSKGAELITLGCRARENGHIAQPQSPAIPTGEFLNMNGREVYKFAVRAVGQALDEALKRAGMTADQVDLLVPHQANIRIIDAAAERLGMPRERVVINIEKYGNTAAASIPLSLNEAVNSGRLKPGMTVALVGFGAGLTYGATLVKF